METIGIVQVYNRYNYTYAQVRNINMKPKYATKKEVIKATKQVLIQYAKTFKALAEYDRK